MATPKAPKRSAVNCIDEVNQSLREAHAIAYLAHEYFEGESSASELDEKAVECAMNMVDERIVQAQDASKALFDLWRQT